MHNLRQCTNHNHEQKGKRSKEHKLLAVYYKLGDKDVKTGFYVLVFVNNVALVVPEARDCEKTPCFSSGSEADKERDSPGGMSCDNVYTTRRPSGTDF